MIVDINGKGPVSEDGEICSIAFRSDIDGLKIKENSDLPYKSTTDYAHMCGHDGHMTIMMTFIAFLQKKLDKIPSNKWIWIIF